MDDSSEKALTLREKRLANLKPFKPGQSGNPAGKKPGTVSIKTELRELVSIILKGEFNNLNGEVENMTVARKVALTLLEKALADGDLNAVVKIMEHLDGKPAQAVNIGGQAEGTPVQMVIGWAGE